MFGLSRADWLAFGIGLSRWKCRRFFGLSRDRRRRKWGRDAQPGWKRSASHNRLFPDWPYLEQPTRHRGTSTAEQPQPHRGTVNRQTATAEAPERPVQTVKPSTPTRRPPETVQPVGRPQNSRRPPPGRARTVYQQQTTHRKRPADHQKSRTGQTVAHPVGRRRLQVQPVKAEASRKSPPRANPVTFARKVPRARTRDRNFSGTGQENADPAGVEKSRHLRRPGNCQTIVGPVGELSEYSDSFGGILAAWPAGPVDHTGNAAGAI